MRPRAQDGSVQEALQRQMVIELVLLDAHAEEMQLKLVWPSTRYAINRLQVTILYARRMRSA